MRPPLPARTLSLLRKGAGSREGKSIKSGFVHRAREQNFRVYPGLSLPTVDVFEDVVQVPKLKASAQPWATMNAEITAPGPLPTPTSVQLSLIHI